jgi:NAD(P)-dependent dehydrogenase (short-subunit alcohol dehydrogenase family)
MPPIKGQSILVIGGSSGIGFGIVKLALAENVAVAMASSNADKVSRKVAEASGLFPSATVTGHVLDISTPNVEADLEKLLGVVTANATNLLDHIVVTAGAFDFRPADQHDFAYLAAQLGPRVAMPLLLAKVAPRFLQAGPTSSLIFTGGQVGERAVKGYAVGSFLAAGLFGAVRSMALDLAPRRVNLVSVGPTETEMWGDDEASRGFWRGMAEKNSPLGKPGTPAEVAEAFVYLMRDTNATGIMVSSSSGVVIQPAQ